jgi:hypothetical protein
VNAILERLPGWLVICPCRSPRHKLKNGLSLPARAAVVSLRPAPTAGRDAPLSWLSIVYIMVLGTRDRGGVAIAGVHKLSNAPSPVSHAERHSLASRAGFAAKIEMCDIQRDSRDVVIREKPEPGQPPLARAQRKVPYGNETANSAAFFSRFFQECQFCRPLLIPFA